MLVSIVIRTLNEARYLDDLLKGIARQVGEGIDVEVVLVDSGSSDATLDIAKAHGCRIIHITREEFSFGRALNLGCAAARGEIIAMISGHCVPTDARWLQTLCRPLLAKQVVYSYGRQFGGPDSHFSECRIFAKYYPAAGVIPQQGYFCNNANSAILRQAWARHQFDEDITGLEDMELAKRLVADGEAIGYVAEAGVYHYHNETWGAIKRRFEREAIALKGIMPQIHVRKRDLLRYIVSSIGLDWRCAWKQGCLARYWADIVRYRCCQYWGSFVGNNDHRRLSHAQKEAYFFPDP